MVSSLPFKFLLSASTRSLPLAARWCYLKCSEPGASQRKTGTACCPKKAFSPVVSFCWHHGKLFSCPSCPLLPTQFLFDLHLKWTHLLFCPVWQVQRGVNTTASESGKGLYCSQNQGHSNKWQAILKYWAFQRYKSLLEVGAGRCSSVWRMHSSGEIH